jgi:glycosyltransferase involved in cell wall biosynthesis
VLDGRTAIKVAYLINQYPHVSHSFIRREVRALEGHGICVERYSVRCTSGSLVDPADIEEKQRTRVVLGRGVLGLAIASLVVAFTRPLRWCGAAGLAFRMGWRSGRGVWRHFVYLAEACVLLRWLRRSGVQHLHAHFGTNATDVALLTRVLGGPSYSFTIHGPEEFDRPERLSLGDKIEQAAFVATVSEFGRSQAIRWSSYRSWRKIHVIHCGVDQSFFAIGPQAVPDVHRMVCVGRLSEQKGHLRLLEALAVLKARGIRFEVVFAGDGSLRPIIEEEVRRSGLSEDVRIVGWASGEQVRQHLLESRVLLLPSFAEGLPVVLMEAFALGRPVITTYVAGIPELVRPGVSGWLVPAGSVEPLADAIQEALATPCDRLTEMGRAGAKAVATSHDAVAEAAKLAQLLTEAVAPAPASLPEAARAAVQLPSSAVPSALARAAR